MLVLNFSGGTSVGKSTCSAYFYSMLKMQGINCELVNEYAKQKVWEEMAKSGLTPREVEVYLNKV